MSNDGDEWCWVTRGTVDWESHQFLSFDHDHLDLVRPFPDIISIDLATLVIE